ncbi:MAG: ribose 5-phosphate isomerase B [Candidatus Omnitrophica bacterium]|nr:ribose 5-phosphate isomerase B [Candidatus Omnitrophota bacterium]
MSRAARPLKAQGSRLKGERTLHIAIGADHGGFALKAKLVAMLQAQGLVVADLGTHSAEPCDYPRIGSKVAFAVAEGTFDRGILLCKSGIGIAVVANKVPGVRAGVCGDGFDAQRARAHNDANVLVLGAEKLSEAQAKKITQVWLATPFEAGGRHERRVKQIAAIERKVCRQQTADSRPQRNITR